MLTDKLTYVGMVIGESSNVLVIGDGPGVFSDIRQYFTESAVYGIINKRTYRRCYMFEIKDIYYPMPKICKYLGISRDTALRWITTKIFRLIR